MTSGKVFLPNEIKELVEGSGYIYLSSYVGKWSKTRVVISEESGYKYDVYLNGILKGQRANFSDKRNPFVLENISKWCELEDKPFLLCEDNVYTGALNKLFFQCLREECQEIFDMNWNSIQNGRECPFCAGKRVGKYNNLAYLRPEMLTEWDYNKNEKSPTEYTEKSGEKVYWICSECEHPWGATIADRSNGTGCPKCANARKESKIADELKHYILNNYESEDEYKIFRNPETNRFLPYDIYIFGGENKSINGFYIEIHGKQHYKVCYFHAMKAKGKETSPDEEFEYQRYLDRLKRRFARKNGTYIEIDLRKIKNTEEAIKYIDFNLKKFSNNILTYN